MFRKIIKHRVFFALMAAYPATQFFWPLSELLFIAAGVVAIGWLAKNHRKNGNFSPLGYTISVCFIVNLLLTFIYIPMLVLNPEINWSLQDTRQEADPMILLAYFPAVNFVAFTLAIAIAALSIKVAAMQNAETNANQTVTK